MKKGLLLACTLLMGATAFAAKDDAVYESKNGLTFTNISMNTNYVGTWNSLEMTVVPNFNRVRTGCILGDKVYVTSSNVFEGEGTADGGLLMIFDANTGDFVKSVQLTLDGEAWPAQTLAANTIGVDDYGHIYIGGFVGTFFTEKEDGTLNPNGLPLYWLKDPDKGEATRITKLTISEDEEAYSGRVDYINLAGDITRTQAPCVVMAMISTDSPAIAGWMCDVDSDEWFGHMNGDTASVCEYNSDCFFPEVIQFSSAGSVNILYDEEEYWTNFYADSFNCRPALLNTDGAMVDNFATVPTDGNLMPKDSPTGCNEFTMGGTTYFMYPMNDYDGGAHSNLVKFGEDNTFGSMEFLYDFPQMGMGGLGQGQGPRIQCYQAKVVTDENGKEGAYIFTFKSMNGFAYYLLAEEGFAAGVEAVEAADANAPVEYFNLQGVRVANPENGIFVRRQGTKVSKVAL